MYTVTVTAVYKLLSGDATPDETTVKTKVDCFAGKDLQHGIAKLYRDVLVSSHGFKLFSVCHTVTK